MDTAGLTRMNIMKSKYEAKRVIKAQGENYATIDPAHVSYEVPEDLLKIAMNTLQRAQVIFAIIINATATATATVARSNRITK